MASAARAPDGTPHGGEGVCVTAAGGVVVISPDGTIWDLPAVFVCENNMYATVTGVRLLGFTRGQCLTGPERAWCSSGWCGGPRSSSARGKRFEIADRRVVLPAAVEEALTLGSHPFAAIIRRELAEAALTR